MPLADGERRVTVAAEDLGQEPVRLRHRRVVAGKAGRELDDATHAADVMVAPGEQAGTGRRAQRRGVEVAVPQPAGGETIERRRRDVGPVATELRVADIVEKDHDDVGCVVRGGGKWRPPRRGAFKCPGRNSLERIRLHDPPLWLFLMNLCEDWNKRIPHECFAADRVLTRHGDYECTRKSAVRDLTASSEWYERILGPGSQPMAEVIEWELERGGGLQVYELPERAGQGSCTLIVSDIDELAQQLRSTGLAANPEPARNDRVDTIMIKDPDGNSIAFAMPKDPTLAALTRTEGPSCLLALATVRPDRVVYLAARPRSRGRRWLTLKDPCRAGGGCLARCLRHNRRRRCRDAGASRRHLGVPRRGSPTANDARLVSFGDRVPAGRTGAGDRIWDGRGHARSGRSTRRGASGGDRSSPVFVSRLARLRGGSDKHCVRAG